MLRDFPRTLAELKTVEPLIEKLPMDHRGAIAAVNKIRVKYGLNPLNVADMITATLARVEEKINAENEIRP